MNPFLGILYVSTKGVIPMTKSYAGGKDDKPDGLPKDSSAIANDAVRKAEMKMEEIKEEARNEMKRQQKE
jgi:hypothetical protein